MHPPAKCVSVRENARRATSIRADDALIFIDGEKQRGGTIITRHSSDDPCVPEELTKESFFHGARGGNGCRQSQPLRPIRPRK
jgi:hypothetical protein